MVNATGWNELMNGDIVYAVFLMFDIATMYWFTAILFFVFQYVLYVKAKNLTLNFVLGLFFASLYATSIFVKAVSVQFIFIILALELAGIIFTWIMK